MPYIDADGLLKIKFHPLPYQYVIPSDVDKESYVRGWNDVIDGIIEGMPTADVVEVVRCKDCKHFMPLTGYSLCVAHGSDAVDADDFCSWAERKETEDAEIH